MMQAHQVRRLPVVDAEGAVCGIVAQADLARWATSEQTGDLVRDVSEPQRHPRSRRPKRVGVELQLDARRSDARDSQRSVERRRGDGAAL